MALSCCYFFGIAQEKITAEEARNITATTMANFTFSTSNAYYKGMSLESFRAKLCGSAVPMRQGDAMIETAYIYLSKGLTKEEIINVNDGRAVANALQFLSNQHNKGIVTDGTEIFGGNNILLRTAFTAKEGCKWYQFWCHVQVFANWVVENWPTILEILSHFGL